MSLEALFMNFLKAKKKLIQLYAVDVKRIVIQLCCFYHLAKLVEELFITLHSNTLHRDDCEHFWIKWCKIK